MRLAVLFRDEIRRDVIRGTMSTGENTFHILERPWVDNQRNISCIPSGEYIATFMPRSSSGKYKRVFHVQAVTGRSGILIHNGNVVNHTRGCLIIGYRRGTLAGKPAVLNSRTALSALVQEMQEDSFKLVVVGNQKINELEGG